MNQYKHSRSILVTSLIMVVLIVVFGIIEYNRNNYLKEKEELIHFIKVYEVEAQQLIDPSVSRDNEGNWNWKAWDDFIDKYNIEYASKYLAKERDDYKVILPNISYKSIKVTNLDVDLLQLKKNEATAEVKFDMIFSYDGGVKKRLPVYEMVKLKKIEGKWKVAVLGVYFI